MISLRYLLPLLILAAGAIAAQAHAQGSANLPPEVGFTVEPVEPRVGQVVWFNSTSSDADGRIFNLTWRLGDGTRGYGPRVEHRYVVPGDYVVDLFVMDDRGATSSDGRTVHVVPPPADVTDRFGLLPTWLYWLMPLVVGLVLLQIAYLVVSRGQPAVYNWVFFLFQGTSGVKSLTEALAILTTRNLTAAHGPILVANQIASFTLISLFLWFVMVFPRPITAWLRVGSRGAVCLLLSLPFVINLIHPFLSAQATVNAFNAMASGVALVCLGMLIYHGRETDSDEERRRIHLLTVTFVLIVASTLVLSGFHFAYSAFEGAGRHEQAQFYLRVAAVWGLVLSPLVELVAASVLMYAVLRYQLLGIERFVKRTTRGAITAFAVPSIFVTVSNTVEQLFQTEVLAGVRFDFIIAGFVSAVLMVPIQKWVDFAMFRLFPQGSEGDPAYQRQRRIEIFEAQLRYSLLDGSLNAAEIQTLQRLARSIQLSQEEMHEVTRLFPADSVGRLAPPKAVPLAFGQLGTAAPNVASARLLPSVQPAKLVFPTLPRRVFVDIPFTVVVAVVNEEGELVPQARDAVTLSSFDGPRSTKPAWTATVTATNGLALFEDVRLGSVGDVILRADASSLQATPEARIETVPPPQRLDFESVPRRVRSGEPFRVAVRVPDRAAGTAVAITLMEGRQDARVGGTLVRPSTDGIAIFDDVVVDRAGKFRLGATAGGLLGVQSEVLLVEPGPAARLEVVSAPTEVAAATRFAIKLRAVDAAGNRTSAPGRGIRLLLRSETDAPTSLATSSSAPVGGVVTFEGLQVPYAGPWVVETVADGLEPLAIRLTAAETETASGPPADAVQESRQAAGPAEAPPPAETDPGREGLVG